MTNPDLLVRDLTFRYPPVAEQCYPVLEGASFSLAPGDIGAMIGPADAGKTTLARILVGLVPRFTGGSVSGTIRCRDAEILHSPPYDLLEKIGLVFQDSDEQIFTTRCDTEIAFALESLGLPREDIAIRISRTLAQFDLSGFHGRNPTTLSGGEKKRLLVACIAAIDPPVWILDESLEELDRSWKLRILEYIRSTGKTALFLDSRWTPLLAKRCAKVWVLSKGRVVDTIAGAGLREEGILLRSLGAGPRRPRGEPERFLQADGLFFRFPGPGTFSVSVEKLELSKGELCSLIGRNGSGKSTLGRILCGLLVPHRGLVSVNMGTGSHAARAEELNRTVGYLFQNPDHQIYLPTVRDELALGLKHAGATFAEADRLISDAVRLFSLPDPSTPPALMSYGARRRLQAATFFLLERGILILDEIDSGLSYGEILALLEALLSGGRGIVMITHDVELARRVSDRILLMDAGRISAEFRPSGFGRIETALACGE